MNAPDRAAPRAWLDAELAALPELAATLGRDAARREADRVLPFEGFTAFRATALGALRIPEARGGLGGSLVDLFEVIATLAAADSNLAHALRIHYDFTEALRFSLGSAPATAFDALQLDRVLSGAIYGGASTELGTARPGDITTKLVQDGDGFRISGRKYYSTGTLFSDYARINVHDARDERVAIVIPVKRDGLRVEDDWDGMGQRMTASGTLVLEHVRVEADEVAARDGTTLAGRHGGALRQLHLVAVAAGIVRAVAEDARRYVREFGRPVLHSAAASAAEDPFIQQTVGELGAHSHAIDALVRENARALDRSADAILAGSADAEARVLEGALATARTQLIVSKLALHAGERLFEVGGASATGRRHNLDRHWRNLRTIFNHNPLLHKARVIGDYDLNGTTTHLTQGRVF